MLSCSTRLRVALLMLPCGKRPVDKRATHSAKAAFSFKPQGHMPSDVDLVYTWVDDRFPGFRDELLGHAIDPRDRDPNRTRDNLQIMRYSLRSIARFAPWFRRIYIVSCRPQRPRWLSSDPRVAIVHHDEIMPAENLPTYNSTAIASYLHRLPGLAERFVYIDDDELFLAPVRPADFIDEASGKDIVRGWPKRMVRSGDFDPRTCSASDLVFAATQELLDRDFGRAERPEVHHLPLFVERAAYAAMMERDDPAIEHTRASRFRRAGNIVPNIYYRFARIAGGNAELRLIADGDAGYASLDNFFPWTAFNLWRIDRARPKFVTLNDNFNQRPWRSAEAVVRWFLDRWLPDPSPFEIAVSS